MFEDFVEALSGPITFILIQLLALFLIGLMFILREVKLFKRVIVDPKGCRVEKWPVWICLIPLYLVIGYDVITLFRCVYC